MLGFTYLCVDREVYGSALGERRGRKVKMTIAERCFHKWSSFHGGGGIDFKCHNIFSRLTCRYANQGFEQNKWTQFILK